MEATATRDYSKVGTHELRQMVRSRGIARGPVMNSMGKADCIRLLEASDRGETPDIPGVQLVQRPAAAAPSADELAETLAKLLNGRVQGAGVDPDAVHEIVDATLSAWVRDDLPAVIAGMMPANVGPTISMPEMPAPVVLEGEALHYQFPQVLAWLRADVPVWLWGAPGAGKTHLGRQLAKAMGIACYTMSIDETTTANKLLGFQNLVSGEYVPGWLYEPYKAGGLVVIDEIDTGNPGIIAGLNALLANGHYMFPNGETVERHAMFRVMACANTKGTGAVAGFTARQRLDAATLNRFAVVEFRYDEGLELQLVTGTPSDSTPWKAGRGRDATGASRWVEWVQKVRREVGQNVLISPRASILGAKALRAGIPAHEVADALIFALCAKDTVTAIKQRCGDPTGI